MVAELLHGLVSSATQKSTSPQTIVYKINPKASWNDGTPITAVDFVYYWRTNDGKDCPPPPASDSTQTKGCLPESTAGYDRIKSVTGSDAGKTVTVVLRDPVHTGTATIHPRFPLRTAHGRQSRPIAPSERQNPSQYRQIGACSPERQPTGTPASRYSAAPRSRARSAQRSRS